MKDPGVGVGDRTMAGSRAGERECRLALPPLVHTSHGEIHTSLPCRIHSSHALENLQPCGLGTGFLPQKISLGLHCVRFL